MRGDLRVHHTLRSRPITGGPSNPRGPSRRIGTCRCRDSIENGLDAIKVTTQRHALQLGQPFLAQQDPGLFGGAPPDRPMASGDQALGHRVGWHNATRGVDRSDSVACLRQSAVEGSKKQSARRPTCRVRATLASRARSRARSAIIAGKGPSWSAASSSVLDNHENYPPERDD